MKKNNNLKENWVINLIKSLEKINFKKPFVFIKHLLILQIAHKTDFISVSRRTLDDKFQWWLFWEIYEEFSIFQDVIEMERLAWVIFAMRIRVGRDLISWAIYKLHGRDFLKSSSKAQEIPQKIHTISPNLWEFLEMFEKIQPSLRKQKKN